MLPGRPAIFSRVSCRMKHAADQHPQAPIKFRLSEGLPEHRRITVGLAKISIPTRHEGEWDAFGTQPLGYPVHCFAMSQLDVEQRRITWARFDQGQRLGNPNSGA